MPFLVLPWPAAILFFFVVLFAEVREGVLTKGGLNISLGLPGRVYSLAYIVFVLLVVVLLVVFSLLVVVDFVLLAVCLLGHLLVFVRFVLVLRLTLWEFVDSGWWRALR